MNVPGINDLFMFPMKFHPREKCKRVICMKTLEYFLKKSRSCVKTKGSPFSTVGLLGKLVTVYFFKLSILSLFLKISFNLFLSLLKGTSKY